MLHRVAIIGQSNSILSYGFVHQLAKLKNVELGNMARLGATPSILLPFFATPELFENHDFCIFDISVVDQGQLWAGALDLRLVAQWVEYGIHVAKASGCIPILLVIPHQAAIPRLNEEFRAPILQQLYRTIALRTDAICLDLTESLHSLGSRCPELLQSAFEDPDHLAESFSSRVASELLGIMDSMCSTPILTRTSSVALPVFERVNLVKAAAKQVWRDSSLFSAQFAVLEKGDEIRVSTGTFRRAHGILINRPACNGNLLISGSEVLVKNLTSVIENDLPYTAQIVPLLGPMGDAAGDLTLSMTHKEACVTEPSSQAVAPERQYAEISELLLERSPQIVKYEGALIPAALRKLPLVA